MPGRGIIRTCGEYGVEAERIEGLTGVWVDADKGLGARNRRPRRQMLAVGYHARLRFQSQHGLGLLDLIVPCGIGDRGVTSQPGNAVIHRRSGGRHMLRHLTDIFGWKLVRVD